MGNTNRFDEYFQQYRKKMEIIAVKVISNPSCYNREFVRSSIERSKKVMMYQLQVDFGFYNQSVPEDLVEAVNKIANDADRRLSAVFDSKGANNEIQF